MDAITFTDLAARFDNACRTPAVGRTAGEEQWQRSVLGQCKAIEPDFLELNNRYARQRTPGFHEATSVWDAMQRYAANHPEKFGDDDDIAKMLAGGDLSTIISIGGPRRMCEVLSKMADEGTAPTAAATADISATLDVLRNEVAEAAKSQALERLDSAQLETRMLISASTRKRMEVKGLLGFIQAGSKHGKRYLWLNGRPLTRAEVLSIWNSEGSTRAMTGQHGPRAD